MKNRVYIAGAVLLAFAFAAFADDPPKKPEMDPAMMEAMMKAMMPGEPHKKLDGMAGTWDTKITMWMMPGMDPTSSTGTSENKWIMGGRYLEQRFTGSFMGMPFEGIGYTGYDNIKKQYFGTWMDNMSTGVMMSTGAMGGDGKTWNFTATMPDPMTGKDSTVEEKIVVVDADHHTMEMWGPAPDGRNYKMMEIAYSRKK